VAAIGERPPQSDRERSVTVTLAERQKADVTPTGSPYNTGIREVVHGSISDPA
jgi:hypothetical protein